MTMWEDLMNCICQNGPQRPGMQEVLNTLERHTVCTGTQCFEGEEDAFGITTTPNGAPTNNTNFFMFMMFMMMVAMFMRMKKPSSSSKPGSSSSHSEDEPPGPAPAVQ
mmetsp:Transcript_23448/g.47675  ORF Transcript_23448/g.47675 Transcript_23448/m.47675 type:complete len:108 (-) Transcript_23448:97-420(-)|eukprot:CAMPEP_0119055840 /NCGR_PEP_ID=MMETSP1178-20130426/482_1 /TAXON_ID=33656 /ORGANISM="unid sp, Strain CCMP2000" /LENGTH=107 /DNA_ID=CAMNT_0007036487 /DNA_START=105 /DNA_END=428 /DNA_ORIENTATION=-